MSRDRSYQVTVPNGTMTVFGNVSGRNPVLYEKGSCTDFPGRGFGDCQPFIVDKYYLTGGEINSKDKVPGFFKRIFDHYIADSLQWDSGICSDVSSYPGELPAAEYASQAVSRTTPNHPKVDMVQNVLEFRDIPRILHFAGQTLITKLSENYLRYQYGIVPLVRDVKRTLDFQDLVMRRVKDLEKLRSPKGLRKSVTLDNLSASVVNNNVFLHSDGIQWVETLTTICQKIVRGHVRYSPLADYSHLNQREMYDLATKAFYGLEVSFSSLWEAMPWSWMIDWFTNVGDILEQSRNVISLSCTSCSLMYHTRREVVFHNYDNGAHFCKGGRVVRERKQRIPASPTDLSAHMPFLTAYQVGIAASLLVMGQKYALSPRQTRKLAGWAG
uniref:Uncharacterized protein n=1 Tax=Leviviridae sp. TaxID=2027243 RepID=A0A514D0J5_9VIRU|nr:MAG: hypothetical protein H4Bulk462300e1158_000003 [Leviviridae sp.]